MGKDHAGVPSWLRFITSPSEHASSPWLFIAVSSHLPISPRLATAKLIPSLRCFSFFLFLFGTFWSLLTLDLVLHH